MKKKILLLLTATLCLSMAGCGTKATDSGADGAAAAVESSESADMDSLLAEVEQELEEEGNGDTGFIGPEDFVQEQSGKTSFKDLDEIISCLTKGQGYAKIKPTGSDEEMLLVTELVFEADHSAYEASTYAMKDGECKNFGLVSGNGSSYPLRYEDGIIYGGDNHQYSSYYIVGVDGKPGIMMKDFVDDGVNSGSGKISGFLREENSYDNDKEFNGSQEDLDKMMAEREKKPIIEFTMVE